jgi:hypothetical protein
MNEFREGAYLAEAGGADQAHFLRFLEEAEEGERAYQGQPAVQRSYRVMRTQLWRDATPEQVQAWAENKVRQGGGNIEEMLRLADSLRRAAQEGAQEQAGAAGVQGAGGEEGDEQILMQMRALNEDQRGKEEFRYRNLPYLRISLKFLKRSLDSLDRQGMAFDDNTPLHEAEVTFVEEIKKKDAYSARREDLEKIFASQPVDLVELSRAIADLKTRRENLSSNISVLDEAKRQKLVSKRQTLNDLVGWASASAGQAEAAAEEAAAANDKRKEIIYQQRGQLLRQLERIVEAWIKSKTFDPQRVHFSKAVEATKKIIGDFNDAIEDLEDVLLLEKWKQDGVIGEEMTIEQAKEALANKIMALEIEAEEIEENRGLIVKNEESAHGSQT